MSTNMNNTEAAKKTAFEVAEALSMLSMSIELKNYIESKTAEWTNFGKMNSHIYRAMLMRMMAESGLTQEAKFMVFFFFSVIKNQPRILKAMDQMTAEEKAKPWFSATRDFIATKITQYVSAMNKTKKFPAVNIPGCNPGLDILNWCLITPKNDRTVEVLKDRTTFCQLNLNDEMQTLAKVGYENYWNNIVKGTKNPDKESQTLEEPKMREEYYLNPASDKYNLIGVDLKEIPPMTNQSGYTRDELVRYMASI
jgi:hypothetical protein